MEWEAIATSDSFKCHRNIISISLGGENNGRKREGHVSISTGTFPYLLATTLSRSLVSNIFPVEQTNQIVAIIYWQASSHMVFVVLHIYYIDVSDKTNI